MNRSERAQGVAEKLGLKMIGPWNQIIRELDIESGNYAYIDEGVWNHLLDLEEEVERLRSDLKDLREGNNPF